MHKKWVYPLGLVILAFIGFYYFQKYKIAPDLELEQLKVTELSGENYSFKSLNGKKTMICFAASWCGPCRQELKTLSRIKNEILNEVEIIVVSDEPTERIEQFKQHVEFPFQWLRLNAPFSSIGINSIPSSYLVNTKGEVVKKTVGEIDWEDPSTSKHLLKLME